MTIQEMLEVFDKVSTAKRIVLAHAVFTALREVASQNEIEPRYYYGDSFATRDATVAEAAALLTSATLGAQFLETVRKQTEEQFFREERELNRLREKLQETKAAVARDQALLEEGRFAKRDLTEEIEKLKTERTVLRGALTKFKKLMEQETKEEPTGLEENR